MNRNLLNTDSVASDDFEETQKVVSERFCDHHMSLSRRETSVAYHHQYVRTGAISFCRMKYGSDVRIDTENNDDFYLIQIPLSGTDLQQHDRNSVLSDSHRATLHMPGDPLHMHWSNDCEKLAIRIERQYLDQLGSAICGRNVANELSMNYEILLNDARGQALKQRAMLLFSEMTTTPDLFSHEIILQQNIENLSSSLLLWYSNVQQFNNQQKVLPRHVRLATDYLEANAHLPIDATELARLSGVSLRSLYSGFHDFLHCTPSRYLREIRLQKVRQDLLCPAQPANVTAIATRWGFSQLGRFSSEYAQRFGESPRDTIKRR